MAIPTSYGYEGTVQEQQWAALGNVFEQEVAVTSGAWNITAVSGLDRTVRSAVGSFYADGILNVASVTTDLQLPTVTGSPKWYTILLHQDWTFGTSGQSSLIYAGGGTAKTVNLGADTTPGLKCNYPLALVQVTAGVQVPTNVTDLRTTLGEARRGWKDEWIAIGKPGTILDDSSHGHTWAFRYSVPAGRIEIRGAIQAEDGAFSAANVESSIGSPLPTDAWPNRRQYHIGAAAGGTSIPGNVRFFIAPSDGQIRYFSNFNPAWMSFDGWVYDLD